MAKRLCLIDDDIFILDALKEEMTRHGFELRAAPGAAAGLDLIRREGADIVVTDINMPGTNGMQLIAQIRSELPSLPIVAMSGSYDEAGRLLSEAALEVGATCAIAKPFRASDLVNLISTLLGAPVASQSVAPARSGA